MIQRKLNLRQHITRHLFAGVIACCLLTMPAQSEPVPSSFITLGTMGGPIPSPTRSQPANLLRTGNASILIDVGDGTLEQLAKVGVPATSIDAVIISHLHFDHIGGLFAFLGLYQQVRVQRELTIYGPPGTRQMVNGLFQAMQPSADVGAGLRGVASIVPGQNIRIVELSNGDQFTIDSAKISVVSNSHYSFPADSEDAKRFQSLSFRLDLADRSIVYTGDTGPSEAVERLAKNADILFSEVIDTDAAIASLRLANPSFTDAQVAAIAPHFSEQHLTPEAVGLLAARAGVRHLVLTHNASVGLESLGDIRKNFNGVIHIASDLDHF